MASLPLILQIVTLALVVTLGLLILAFRPRQSADTGGEVLRSEADRIRSHVSEEMRGLRQEISEALRGGQDSLEKRLDAGVEAIRTPITAIGQKLDADMKKLSEEAASQRDTMRAAVEAKLDATDKRLVDAARETREALAASFKETRESLTETLSGLGTHQKERLDKLLSALDMLIEKQGQAAEALRQTVEGRLDKLRQENSEKLDEMRKTVDEKLQTELEKRLGESFRTVSEQLDRVHKGLGEMQTLATGVGDLKKVLSNVKTRGILGEVQLGMLLDQMLAPNQYATNTLVKPETNDRVEFAIRLPGRDEGDEILMPVDSKFPQEDYLRLVEASERGDVEAMKLASDALEVRVKACAKDIHDKYICPPHTTDYAILFLPTEGLFAEVVRRPGLMEQIQRDYHVSIAGPTTLTAQLSAFSMGFRSLALQKRSGEVWKLLSAVQGEFASHGKVVETLKKQLSAATNTIDKLGTRTNVMNRKLREVEALPAEETAEILGLPLPDDME
ncbi:DNA recombination protein RmuC [Rhizomicrobium palustre]|uniref:DNA recombination protein RmuC homolog n=1 Tax=Rhizomicrobium palustre TaxID=189966 RepID=A0A846MWT5_9PROT|nr:DNA recombination protein RmuC [Rhizomicrobium palustre]NIK87866.1 DNA recombination protein RmuC [Rhizomicrobium palustre]